MNQESKNFRIEGRAQLEDRESLPVDVKLMAYAFDRGGQLLGRSELGTAGEFTVSVKLAQPGAVEVVVGPEDDPQSIRKSSALSRQYSAKDWQSERDGAAIRDE